MSDIRYLLDENVDPLYRRELLRREPTLAVWKIDDVTAPPEGTSDPAILIWCEANDFILVTNNRHSMPEHLRDHLAQGRHIPGILELNADLGIGVMLDELVLIWAASNADEFRDQLVYLPL
jgi:hypothetical protein